MANVTIQRIPFSQDTDNRMRTLKGRTQITPNLLQTSCTIIPRFCKTADHIEFLENFSY